MPKLWDETIEAHRASVRDAILDAVARLASEGGPASVTMSRIADEAGIGRATLYKYFPDVEAVLVAWHERHVAGHLKHLSELRDQLSDPGERLRSVLEAYALISHGHDDTELAALLHRGEHAERARRELRNLFRGLLADAAKAGEVREDVPAEELAGFCLHALGAAGAFQSKAAVRRLVRVVLAGLRPGD